ncbi:MAG: hypothetical protein H0U01_07755 [Acidimicrobiia bacterium]|nr:hypothetical protein [Acidimicrobiia bacterium]
MAMVVGTAVVGAVVVGTAVVGAAVVGAAVLGAAVVGTAVAELRVVSSSDEVHAVTPTDDTASTTPRIRRPIIARRTR